LLWSSSRENNLRPETIPHSRLITCGQGLLVRARQKCLTRGEPNNTHLTLVANTTTQPKYTKLTFDTDSYEIMVDNCCSQSITNNIKDYIDPPTNTSVQIK